MFETFETSRQLSLLFSCGIGDLDLDDLDRLQERDEFHLSIVTENIVLFRAIFPQGGVFIARDFLVTLFVDGKFV